MIYFLLLIGLILLYAVIRNAIVKDKPEDTEIKK